MKPASNKIAPREPPPRVPSSVAPVHQTLNSQSAPSSGGGRRALALSNITRTVKIHTDKGAWWSVALLGLLLTAGGLFGVWLQGRFYENGFPTPTTVGEVRAAFTLPTAFTTAGGLIVAAVILASPATATWPTSRRAVAFVTFALLVLMACAVCGHLAGSRVSKILN